MNEGPFSSEQNDCREPSAIMPANKCRICFLVGTQDQTKLLSRLDVAIEFHFGILTTWPLHHYGSDLNDTSWNIVSSVSLWTSAG
jgi:hypothetical protein